MWSGAPSSFDSDAAADGFLVVALTNTLNMHQSERRALIVLNRLEAKKTLKDAAAFVITHSCKKYLLQKKISRNLRPPLTE